MSEAQTFKKSTDTKHTNNTCLEPICANLAHMCPRLCGVPQWKSFVYIISYATAVPNMFRRGPYCGAATN